MFEVVGAGLEPIVEVRIAYANMDKSDMPNNKVPSIFRLSGFKKLIIFSKTKNSLLLY